MGLQDNSGTSNINEGIQLYGQKPANTMDAVNVSSRVNTLNILNAAGATTLLQFYWN